MIKTVKNFMKRLLPSFIVNKIGVLLEKHDFKKWVSFWKKRDSIYNNSSFKVESLEYNIISGAHVIEKGIAMPNRRLGFGYDKIRIVTRQLNNYKTIKGNLNNFACQSAIRSLIRYLNIHVEAGFNLQDDIKKSITSLIGEYKKKENEPLEIELTAQKFFSPCCSFSEFAFQRHSVRNYSSETVPVNEIKEAVKVALSAPSACNRQSTRVKIIESKNRKEEILSIQNGNRGFGYLADKILLITTDQFAWEKKYRTSAYIDAGIFIMNLLYALHERHLCACTLNTHFTINDMKKLWGIYMPQNEVPVALILVGKPLDSFLIAASDRRDVDKIIKVI